MAITLDADQDKKFLEKEEKRIYEETGELPKSVLERKKREIANVYIPPEELEELRETYSEVVVQDFGDEYHMSKADREHMRERYAKFFLLKKKYTKKIRRLDKYIEACRIVVEIIKDTAEKNGVMDPDDFMKEVMKGKIIIEGLPIPKYLGKGKKTLNWDLVMEYILDPSLDYTEFLNNQDSVKNSLNDDELDEEEIDYNQILKDELGDEYEDFINAVGSYKSPQTSYVTDPDAGFAIAESSKERKSLLKVSPEYSKKLKQMYDDSKKSESYLFQLQEEDIQWIREFQEEKLRGSLDARPEFNGNILDTKEVERYLFRLEEWENDHELVEYGQTTVTKAQYEELKSKEYMEAAGWNLRNLYGNKQKRREDEKTRKANSKKIKSLKKMLDELKEKQSKGKKLEGLGGDNIEIRGKDEKKKKGKNGVNTKKKKPKKKAKEQAKGFDKLLLDAVGAKDKDFKSYEKRMKNFTWDGD